VFSNMTSLKTASESQAEFILQSQDELPWHTVICVRRQLPDWWNQAKQKHQRTEFIHAPLCASKDPRFAANLWRLMRGTLPRCACPVLLFCSEGRHRSGVVAALTRHGWLLVSIAYLQRAGFHARAKELALVLLLERKLRKISFGKRDHKR
jgi:protein tyrosine/serine phosphatase